MNTIPKIIGVFVIIIFLVLISTNGRETVQLSQPTNSYGMEEMSVPQGYEFVDAFAYGQYEENVVCIFKETKTGKIFKADGDKIGNEIVVPSGYVFLGASAYGRYSANVAYYIMNNTDGKVYKMKT